MNFLNDLPVASLTFVAGIVGSLIALGLGEIGFDAFTEFLLALGAGSFGIGYVRNQAGRGLRPR